MSEKTKFSPRILWLTAIVFSAMVIADSAFRWATYRYNTFDLAFYVHSFWLTLRGQSHSTILDVSLMGNHAEPICYLALPLFWLWPHPMLFVGLQAALVATMPHTGYRIARRLNFDRSGSMWLALATLIVPATGYMALHEFHPETLSAPLLLLMYEARLAQRAKLFWLWFILALACKENVAVLLVTFSSIFLILDRKRGLRWQAIFNLAPGFVAAAWVAAYVFWLSPYLNGGRVDYGELYGPVGGLTGVLTSPGKALNAVWNAATSGNLVWGLLLPCALLPLLRPRWLLIAAPIFAQHLLSFRSSEWSINFHYAAPLVPLMWIATAEAATRFSSRDFVAAIALVTAIACQVWIGPVRAVVRTAKNAEASWQRAQLRSEMLASIPSEASVVAGAPYLSHLATREKLYSLHHILKGLRTLSRADYVQPPPADFVLIDALDGATLDRAAGYYHPAMKTVDGRVIPDSEVLLEKYLMQATWRPFCRNEMSLLVRSEPPPAKSPVGQGTILDDKHLLADLQLGPPLAGDAELVLLSLEIQSGRALVPWAFLMLRGADDTKYLITKGPVGLGLPSGQLVTELWAVRRPPRIPPGTYQASLHFYDPHESVFPPDRKRFKRSAFDLGTLKLR